VFRGFAERSTVRPQATPETGTQGLEPQASKSSTENGRYVDLFAGAGACYERDPIMREIRLLGMELVMFRAC
jgi:hypothetical protein